MPETYVHVLVVGLQEVRPPCTKLGVIDDNLNGALYSGTSLLGFSWKTAVKQELLHS